METEMVQLATDEDDGDNCDEAEGRQDEQDEKDRRDASGRNVVDKMTLSRKLQNIKFLVPATPTTSNNNAQKWTQTTWNILPAWPRFDFVSKDKAEQNTL